MGVNADDDDDEDWIEFEYVDADGDVLSIEYLLSGISFNIGGGATVILNLEASELFLKGFMKCIEKLRGKAKDKSALLILEERVAALEANMKGHNALEGMRYRMSFEELMEKRDSWKLDSKE